MMDLNLAQRLSFAFAAISIAVFSLVAALSYQHMHHLLEQQLEQQLQARLHRISVFLQDQQRLELLVRYPQLYQNMVGEEGSILVLRQQQHDMIHINSKNYAIPQFPLAKHIQFADQIYADTSMKFAYQNFSVGQANYQLIAAKPRDDLQATLQQYGWQLFIYSTLGIVLAIVFGHWVGQRLLTGLTDLVKRLECINTQDLTQRLDVHTATPEIKILIETINQLLDKIEANYHQLARFSSDIAHELRTPLNNLIAQTQYTLLHESELDVYATLLERHLDEYQSLSHMINNMLFLARSEQHDVPIHREWIPIQDHIAELIDYFEAFAEDQDMSVHADLTKAQQVYADVDLLKRALSNLISNSLKYGQPNTVIQIQCVSHDSTDELQVLTPNVCIEEQHLAHIFERFYRVDVSRQQTQESSGLGLAIVQSIMSLHQGQATVQNTSSGVVFSLHFPKRNHKS